MKTNIGRLLMTIGFFRGSGEFVDAGAIERGGES